jgi:hypothetical protein
MTALIGGVAVHGTPREIVEAMRQTAEPWKRSGLRGYKRAVRRRAWALHHELVRTRRNIWFLRDLERLGEIYIIEEN